MLSKLIDQADVSVCHLLALLIVSRSHSNEKKDEFDTRWIQPIIMGYCNQCHFDVHEGNSAQLILISRRNRHRAGVRMHCRGIDDDGFVANYVETEQVSKRDTLFSPTFIGLFARSFGQERISCLSWWSEARYLSIGHSRVFDTVLHPNSIEVSPQTEPRSCWCKCPSRRRRRRRSESTLSKKGLKRLIWTIGTVLWQDDRCRFCRKIKDLS